MRNIFRQCTNLIEIISEFLAAIKKLTEKQNKTKKINMNLVYMRAVYSYLAVQISYQ